MGKHTEYLFIKNTIIANLKVLHQQLLLWKDRVAFWTLEHARNAFVCILMEMFEQ